MNFYDYECLSALAFNVISNTHLYFFSLRHVQFITLKNLFLSLVFKNLLAKISRKLETFGSLYTIHIPHRLYGYG